MCLKFIFKLMTHVSSKTCVVIRYEFQTHRVVSESNKFKNMLKQQTRQFSFLCTSLKIDAFVFLAKQCNMTPFFFFAEICLFFHCWRNRRKYLRKMEEDQFCFLQDTIFYIFNDKKELIELSNGHRIAYSHTTAQR